VFSKQEFQSWAKRSVVPFAAVMTRIEGRKDDDLLRTYGFRGFPSMALLDAAGEAITKEIPRDLFSMQNIVAAAPAYAKLSAAAAAGDEVDAKAWFLAQLGMGKLGAEAARAQLEELGLAGNSKAEQMVFVLEMNDLWHKARGREATDEDKTAAREAVYAAFKAGKRLPAGASPEPFVDEMLMESAKSNKDAKAFFFTYDRVKVGLVERIGQMKGFAPRYRADLEKNKDDAEAVKRIEASLKRLETSLAAAEEQIAELDALAKTLKAGP
jgi:hypothetical protein